jgi:hypothetical protein
MPHKKHWHCLDCEFCWPGLKVCPKCGGKKAETLPSVTGVLSNIKMGGIEGLLIWAHRLGVEGTDLHEARKKACDVGTIAHAAVEDDLHGREVNWDASTLIGEQRARAERCFAAWKEWREQSRLEMVASEVDITSQSHHYGGTLDIASVYAKRGIIDIKTGNVYPEVLLQVVAYGMLWNEQHPGSPVEEYHILGLGKEDGSFHHHRWDAAVMQPAWDAFCAGLTVWRAAKILKGMV